MIARISCLIAALAASACTATGPMMKAQAEQMELDLVNCKAQLGFGGLLKTEVMFAGGVTTARAVPFDRITAADAERINACAGAGLTKSGGMLVMEPMTAMKPVTVGIPAPVSKVLPAAAAPNVTTAGCPVGFTGMYSGTTYCYGAAN